MRTVIQPPPPPAVRGRVVRSARGRVVRPAACALAAGFCLTLLAPVGACDASPSAACATGDAAACGAAACASRPDGKNVALVNHDLWVVAEATVDPWSAARPAEDGCTEADRYPEDFAGTYSYAIETSPRCGYLTVAQPALTSACAGQTLYVWLWHFGLTAPDPGEAHVGVRVGDFDAWSVTLPIPSESGLFTEEIVLPVDVEAGTPIFYHVDNHGSNSYNLLEVSIKSLD